MTLTVSTDEDLRAEALVERMFLAGVGAFELLCVHLGHRLGLYRALAELSPTTPPRLAEKAGISARYAREWLEQQAVAGFLHVTDADADADERRYRLPDAYVDVLVDPESINYAIPFGDFVVCAAKPMNQLLEAYRTGGGVHHSHYDPEHREGQGAFNRPAFLKLLASDWLPQGLPDVHRRLLANPPARVADLGSGLGWACIGFARSYPKAFVDGFDIDAPSIHQARRHAEDAGVADRVTFGIHDAADRSLAGTYDLVCMFEVLHDVARPVDVLRTVKRLLAPGGTALVVDERVADRFTAPGDEVERFMYTCSVLHCLPIALVEQPSAATGTVLRSDTVRAYAAEAGFAAVEVLPIDNDFFRFYKLDTAPKDTADDHDHIDHRGLRAVPRERRGSRQLVRPRPVLRLQRAPLAIPNPRRRGTCPGDPPRRTNQVNVLRLEPTASGFVLEAEVDVRIGNQPYYERTLWLVTTDQERISAITLYCSGEWDTETKARQARKAPMLRP